jgi:hypothetical protein
MADVVASVAAAPKKAFSFASNNVLAFIVLAILLMVLFVAVEARKPGAIAGKVSQIPVVGNWATRRAA